MKQSTHGDGSGIRFEDLFIFLFPHHEVVKALEKKRLQTISVKVKKKAMQLSATASASGPITPHSLHHSDSAGSVGAARLRGLARRWGLPTSGSGGGGAGGGGGGGAGSVSSDSFYNGVDSDSAKD